MTSLDAPADQRTIPFRYYNVIRNCGDAVTSYILNKSFGLTGRIGEAREEHLLAIGSIFFMANRKSTIWGSGVLDPKAHIPEIDPAKIHALRGRKTVEHLRGLGYKLPEVPLGDPGILVGDLIDTPLNPKYRAAIVPHHTGFHSKKWDSARGSKEFCVVDMMDDSLAPLQQIAEAEVVLSQSLHGLIFAAALGKPYLWISGHSSEIWNWKFLDWFSTCENGQGAPVLLDASLDSMIGMAELRSCHSSKSELKAAFPTHLIDDRVQVRGDFRVSRMMSPAHVFLKDTVTAVQETEARTAQQFSAQVGEIRSKVFDGSPEPTYLAITHLSAKHVPTRAALLAGQRYLDENREALFLWYPGDVPQLSFSEFVLSPTTFGDARLQSGTILVRPDGYLSLDRKFASPKV
ncbi:polysaccharide pyruvyl transferase family protein [Paracoccus endophyticus]|uniref:polysaccharide pyruvyl transferase family protein n=1 Tax=Paracoccus endophyticus TaxID=2233774 RepID=UPI0013A6BAF1|nr:polysaccharide pyruvyl transferase family protein [Paracoccus endophyticus]